MADPVQQRIVASDFSLGELSPEFSGRTDTDLFYRGVERMENAEPYGLGGFHRSPGTMYSCTTRGSGDKAVLIPWMVTADHSFIIELTDGHIRLLSSTLLNTDKYPLFTPVLSGGSEIDITDLDPTSTSVVAPYDATEMLEVDWAQSNQMIVIAHKNKPLFYFQVTDYDTFYTDGKIEYTYGIAPIVGQSVGVSSQVAGWDTTEIYESLTPWMQEGVTYLANGYIDGKSTSGIKLASGKLSILSSITVLGTALVSATTLSYTGDIAGTITGLSVYGIGIAAGTKAVSYDNTGKTLVIDTALTESITGKSVTIVNASERSIWKGEAIEQPGQIFMDLLPCSKEKEYPGVVAFFNNRLMLSGSWNEPNTIYGSRPNDHFNFSLAETIEYDVTVAREPSDAILVTSAVKFTGKTTLVKQSGDAWSANMRGYKLKSLKTAGGVSVYYVSNDAVVTSVSNDNLTITISPGVMDSNWSTDSYFNPVATAIRDSLMNDPYTVVFSQDKSSDIVEYDILKKTTQQIGASNAMKIILNTAENESVMWMETQGDLIIGTKTSEWVIPVSSDATNYNAAVVSRHGSCRMKPAKIGGSLVYVQDSRSLVKEFGETGSRTINEMSNHLFRGKAIVDFDYTQSPEESLYFVLNDGSMVKCLMNNTARTMAWTRRVPKAGDSYESVAVINTVFGDKVFCSVNRDIDGVSTRFIEIIADNTDLDISNQCYSGACRYGSTLANKIIDLDHLEGESVLIRARRDSDETYFTTSGVVNGSGEVDVTDPDNGGAAVLVDRYMVGLPEPMTVTLQRLDNRETDGIPKSVTNIFLRMLKSSDYTVKYSEDSTLPVNEVDVTSLDTTKPYYSGVVKLTYGGSWSDDQRIIIESSDAGPVGILSMIADITVGSGA